MLKNDQNREYMVENTGEVFDSNNLPRNFVVVSKRDYFMSTQTCWKHPYRYEKSYVSQWITRLCLEAKERKESAWFITLTFDNRNLFHAYSDSEIKKDFPLVDKKDVKRFFEECPGYRYYGQLLPPADVIKEDERQYYRDCLQRFMKRLRKHVANYCPKVNDVKYFAVSENGDLLNRFHFHLLLFGVPYNSVDIGAIWKHGFVTCKPCSSRAVRYCCKYMFKRSSDKLTFSLKSNGLGLKYVVREDVRSFLKARQTRVLHVDGYSYFMGRFLCEKVFTEEERKAQLDRYFWYENKRARLVNSSDPDGLYYVGFQDVVHDRYSVSDHLFNSCIVVSKSEFQRLQSWMDDYRKQAVVKTDYENMHRRKVSSRLDELSITNPLYYSKLIKQIQGVTYLSGGL